MADLSDKNSSQTIKLVGADSVGLEQDFVQSTASGAIHTNIRDASGNAASIINTLPTGTEFSLVVRPIPFELPTYTALAFDAQVGNNKSMLALQNTSTSVVTLREVWIINDRTTATTGVAGLFQLNRITSFTGGTTITPNTFDTNDILPAGITLATGATVAGEGAILRQGRWSTDEWGTGTLDVEGLDHAIQNIYPFFQQPVNGKGIVIRQNQGIHLKFATNSANGDFNIRFIFTVT